MSKVYNFVHLILDIVFSVLFVAILIGAIFTQGTREGLVGLFQTLGDNGVVGFYVGIFLLYLLGFKSVMFFFSTYTFGGINRNMIKSRLEKRYRFEVWTDRVVVFFIPIGLFIYFRVIHPLFVV